MKKIILSIFISLFSLSAFAQPAAYDSVAGIILDRMTNFIGELQSVSFKLDVAIDKSNDDNSIIKVFGHDEVYMVGPDKMMVNAFGVKGHRSFFYNGTQLAYYSHDENNFGIIDAQPTIMGTIDSAHANYDFEFPAADFFYPSFTDDLIQTNEQINYIGKTTVNGKECFQIMAIGKELNVQFLISNDAFNLPVKMVIYYKNKKGCPQYEASFSDWQINPVLPEAMFEFSPPPGAAEVVIVSKIAN